jgi:hypothetical protein
MANLFKRLSLIIIAALIPVLLFGPPLSIAKNLPTVCNIFDKKMTEKAGSCGHRAVFSKIQDKSFEVGAVLSFHVDLETSHFLIIQRTPLSVSISFANNTQSNPLRC